MPFLGSYRQGLFPSLDADFQRLLRSFDTRSEYLSYIYILSYPLISILAKHRLRFGVKLSWRERKREMVRSPCCEKMGLKKGPWTPDEDRILVSYIQQHGHPNWRALPKQAGLLRCGKSCRLRWTNYLRPDIKRGNFTREEEETIVKLHELLGNRWSAIAARLPGRTDNEIKNVWHTHLKKKLKTPHHSPSNLKPQPITLSKALNVDHTLHRQSPSGFGFPLVSPQTSSSEFSSNATVKDEPMDASETFAWMDESFRLEEFSDEKSRTDDWLPSSPARSCSFNVDDGMEFWYNLLIKTGGPQELPEF